MMQKTRRRSADRSGEEKMTQADRRKVEKTWATA
jgi:hypothetical protein